MSKIKISILTPTFNEEENVEELYKRMKKNFEKLPKYNFEHIFIDNASTDNTVKILKELNKKDKRIKIIVNTRNFGHICSPYWGLLQTTGAATIYLAADLQDPPEMILDFIKYWENGYKIVLATKPTSKTNFIFNLIRRIYYIFINFISNVKNIKNATGFGIYDKIIIDLLRKINDPYPYLRGLVCELGYPIKTISFVQPRRAKGVSKMNLYSLFDYAMMGIISNSLLPIRITSIAGFVIGSISCLFGFLYIILKLLYWDRYSLGIPTLIIGVFFLFGILLFSLGILGEYIGYIYNSTRNRPLVIEKERIGF